MTAIIDYEAGNIASVCNALNRLNAEWTLTCKGEELRRADRIILPGVGDAGKVMESLIQRGLVDIIKQLRQPVLGICVGMQVLCRDSEESNTCCIGIFDAHVRRFLPINGDKVPHMGWNSINNIESRLFRGVEENSNVYYVHSYRADLCPDTIGVTTYCDKMFSAALKYENFYGTQFHPEKSGTIGERILSNFLEF